MASPAPINEINNSRASRGQGVGNFPSPFLRFSDNSMQVSRDSGRPSCAAVAAARKPTTGSSFKDVSGSITISRFEALTFFATVVIRGRLSILPNPSLPLCSSQCHV